MACNAGFTGPVDLRLRWVSKLFPNKVDLNIILLTYHTENLPGTSSRSEIMSYNGSSIPDSVGSSSDNHWNIYLSYNFPSTTSVYGSIPTQILEERFYGMIGPFDPALEHMMVGFTYHADGDGLNRPLGEAVSEAKLMYYAGPNSYVMEWRPTYDLLDSAIGFADAMPTPDWIIWLPTNIPGPWNPLFVPSDWVITGGGAVMPRSTALGNMSSAQPSFIKV